MNEITNMQASFREEQRFRQPWLWVLLFGCALAGLFGAGLYVHGMIKQLVYGQPWACAARRTTSAATALCSSTSSARAGC